MSKVEVTIRYATLKKSSDTFGKMENYVKVKVNNGSGMETEFKSKTIPGDKIKPITWNETFTTTLQANSGAILEFHVMDEDMTSDDTCGTGFFKLDACGCFNYGASQNYNIQLQLPKTKSDVEIGNLHITTRFV